MAYHFPLMPRVYMAIAQEDRFPITDILRQTPDIPENCQWALFLRNHDELTLEMVTDVERDLSGRPTQPAARINLDPAARASLDVIDADRVDNSLLMSFPGADHPCGDEIGMGDNTYLGDRRRAADAMTPDRNGDSAICDLPLWR
jgi:maltose alpha-D-glucosyltransferase/alpha-amylase